VTACRPRPRHGISDGDATIHACCESARSTPRNSAGSTRRERRLQSRSTDPSTHEIVAERLMIDDASAYIHNRSPRALLVASAVHHLRTSPA
jgi:hypothetical protein